MRADGGGGAKASAQKSGVASMRRTSREHKHNRSISSDRAALETGRISTEQWDWHRRTGVGARGGEATEQLHR